MNPSDIARLVRIPHESARKNASRAYGSHYHGQNGKLRKTIGNLANRLSNEPGIPRLGAWIWVSERLESRKYSQNSRPWTQSRLCDNDLKDHASSCSDRPVILSFRFLKIRCFDWNHVHQQEEVMITAVLESRRHLVHGEKCWFPHKKFCPYP